MLGNVAWKIFCRSSYNCHPNSGKKSIYLYFMSFPNRLCTPALASLIMSPPIRHLMGINDIDIKIGSKVIRVIRYGSVVDGCRGKKFSPKIKRPMIFPHQRIDGFSRIFFFIQCIFLRQADVIYSMSGFSRRLFLMARRDEKWKNFTDNIFLTAEVNSKEIISLWIISFQHKTKSPWEEKRRCDISWTYTTLLLTFKAHAIKKCQNFYTNLTQIDTNQWFTAFPIHNCQP